MLHYVNIFSLYKNETFKVRLYDPKSQRRPVINVEVKDAALTTLTVVPQKRYIYIYNVHKKM